MGELVETREEISGVLGGFGLFFEIMWDFVIGVEL